MQPTHTIGTALEHIPMLAQPSRVASWISPMPAPTVQTGDLGLCSQIQAYPNVRLRRASGIGRDNAASTISERDMGALWAAFVKYVEMDRGGKGEIPVSNLGVMTTEEGRRSKVTWEVEDAQDMFYGGQEKDPKAKEREGVSKRVK